MDIILFQISPQVYWIYIQIQTNLISEAIQMQAKKTLFEQEIVHSPIRFVYMHSLQKENHLFDSEIVLTIQYH